MGNQSSRIIDKAKRNLPKQEGRRSSANSHRPAVASPPKPDPRSSSQVSQGSSTSYFTHKKPSSIKSPEDLREWERLKRQHYLLKIARGTNSCAIDKMDSQPKTILDIDTGNGIWAFEMAIEHPSSRVIGIGHRSMPEQTGRPNNLEYIKTDIHQPWNIASESIDLIFQRAMGPTLTTKEWDHLISENIRVLKPGGYIEWVECDVMHHRPGPIQQAIDQHMQQEWESNAMDFFYTTTFDQLVEKRNGMSLLNWVDHMTWDIPIGEWHNDIHSKQLGFINQDVQKATYRNKKLYYATTWAMTDEEYDTAVQALLLEFDHYKSFSRFHCWLARKSMVPSSSP